MKGCCYIVGAGSIAASDFPFAVGAGDLLIAADGGYEYLKAAGMIPHLLLGDFDSMSRPDTAIATIVLPVEKDDTDVGYAMRAGLARGYNRFVVFGGLGGNRLSHTLANVQLLAFAKDKGADVTLIYGGTRVFMLTANEKRTFPVDLTDDLSIFAFGGEAVVSLQGLKYPLERATLTPHFPLGVSNSFSGEEAIVTVHEGMAVVVREQRA